MNESDRIEELEHIINKILIETSLIKAENIALTQMVLGVYRETRDENSFNNIAENFISLLEEVQMEVIDELQNILIPTNDHAELIRKKLTLTTNYQRLRDIYLKKN